MKENAKDIKLEEINCPICGTHDYKIVFKSKDFRLKTTANIFNVVHCNRCDLLFLNPHPIKKELPTFYPADFNKKGDTFLYKFLKPLFSITQNSTISFLKKYKKNGKILDIGCGNGHFLLRMQKEGFDVWGIELNQNAEKFISSCLKGRILYKEIKECNFASQTFDIITLFQTLEHIFDLDVLFCEIKRILKDNGIIYIVVPDTDFYESKVFGPYYYNLEVPRHLYFFNKKSMSNLLVKNGFVITKFVHNHICDTIASTPASFYYGLWNFFTDKEIISSPIVKFCTFLPLIIIRFILRIFFIFENQNLKLLCHKRF